jgi:hypothetical protein
MTNKMTAGAKAIGLEFRQIEFRVMGQGTV